MPRINGPHKNIEQWLNTFHGGGQPAASSAAFGTAGLVFACEFVVERPMTIDAIGYIVGATQSGNVRVAIYRAASRETLTGGTLVVESASTAQGSVNTPQIISVTETLLTPGLYYVVIQGSSTTGTYMRHANQSQVDGWACTFSNVTYDVFLATATTQTNIGSNVPGFKIRVKSN